MIKKTRHLAFEKFLLGGSAIMLALILTAAPSHASPSPSPQKQMVTLDETGDGTLLFKTDTFGQYIKAPMVKTDVKMSIAGPVIRSTVSQTFKNDSQNWVEGIYVFPLPEDAAVDRLRMVIGGRMIEGQIKEKMQAKKIYNTAKRAGKKASLVEQERPNMFTASVANIGPGESIAIQIEYQDTAKIKDGTFSMRFPMTVAPRFSPKPKIVQIASAGGPVMASFDPVLDRHRISPPLLHPLEEPSKTRRLPVSIDIRLDAGFDLAGVTSPYHTISKTVIDADSRQIMLGEGAVPANRDFVLNWRAAPAPSPYIGTFKQTIGEHTYLLSMVTPSVTTATQARHSREAIFVIDTSGSMGGESIEQAKAALRSAMKKLRPGDSFNIIRFASAHSALFSKAQPVQPDTLGRATRWIDGLYAKGGTNMAPAMVTALSDQDPENPRLRQVIFITDGAIGNEQHLFALVKDNLKSSRLFPVGIGSAPNSFFMSRAAKFGRGTFIHIGSTAEVKTKMNKLFDMLSAPVLTDIQAALPKGAFSYPAQLPDLYRGEPVVSITKLDGLPPKHLPLSGRFADRPWSQNVALSEIKDAKGLDVLWARRKIADLEEGRFDRAGAAAIDAEITKTALAYNLVSRLTSLVAVDITPSRPAGVSAHAAPVPTMLPAGWDFAALTGTSKIAAAAPGANGPAQRQNTPMRPAAQNVPLPATASPHIFILLLGGFLMLAGLVLPAAARLTRRQR